MIALDPLLVDGAVVFAVHENGRVFRGEVRDVLADPSAEPDAIEVLTYNVKLMHAGAGRHRDRAERIARKLGGYDLVVLTEAFVNRARNTLLSEISGEYPHTAFIGRMGVRRNGGVVVASRWPIESTDEEYFEFLELEPLFDELEGETLDRFYELDIRLWSFGVERDHEPDEAAIDEDLSREMAAVREIVSLGLQVRTASRLRVRQPLAAAEVVFADPELALRVRPHLELVRDELRLTSVEMREPFTVDRGVGVSAPVRVQDC